MQDQKLRLTLTQYDVAWEDKAKNIALVKDIASRLSGETDIIVLPEMSFSAFTFNTLVAETNNSALLSEIKSIAISNGLAICGSIMYAEEGKCYNRAFFITPEHSFFYDKRHLFRMGQEGEVMTAGKEKSIISYKGFNICLLVCYDLRFPVWSRNVDNEYDLVIYVGNWPKGRIKVWDTLLRARAIENMSYVCGVNRIGQDNNGINYPGLSMMIDQRGEPIIVLPENEKIYQTVAIGRQALLDDRVQFPVWKDADKFEIKF